MTNIPRTRSPIHVHEHQIVEPLKTASATNTIQRFDTRRTYQDQVDSPTKTTSFHNSHLQDPSMTSRNMNNYISLSDVALGEVQSECNSVLDSSIRTIDKPCDKYGFFLDSDEDDDDQVYESKTPTPQQMKSLREREKKWLQMLNNWKYYINFKWEKIRDRCRKGIPHSLRSQAWFYLCGGQIQKRRRPKFYQELLNRDIPEDIRSDITKDLHRQFPMHELFADRNGTGQVDLFNVLKAFAVYKPKIGYCQAQGPIAAVLLMHMPAEHAFWSLVALNDYYISGYFVHNLEEIEIHGHMLFAFIKKYSPSAYSLLKKQNIEPVLYMTEWFMCIYSRNLPWSSVLRVWDMFLCEGVTILFKVGIYLVDVSLRNESTKTCPSMYETCQKLRNIPKKLLEEEQLIKGIRHIELKDSDLLREHKIQVKKYRKTRSKLDLK
ncbi:hypothetical protein RDWZM_009133 [Blomia tropicalis]|uniref:Rab-GAP TBC domain-containing protein n=1 Tax=Blomia tropicalis TaxID=40697 RepID=A0A9Q0RM19_BLOTA|nr:hypothetical protein BLOT_011902 [Blomia tropicalis]KAJ6217976.1 hypothetical protein RDWZM_009133 [Blomia tropicalis]